MTHKRKLHLLHQIKLSVSLEKRTENFNSSTNVILLSPTDFNKDKLRNKHIVHNKRDKDRQTGH